MASQNSLDAMASQHSAEASTEASEERLSASVGKGGVNRQPDVRLVQKLINRHLRKGATHLGVDGICGPATVDAINEFQKRLGFLSPDGRIDPDARTFRALAAIPFSPSVAGAIARLGADTNVTSWEIVKTLLSAHDEYGERLAEKILKLSGPANGDSKPVLEWVSAAQQLFDPTRVVEFHGRLLLIGLSKVDASLQQYLSDSGFIQAISNEVRPDPIESLLRGTAPTAPDRAPLHLDDPASKDYLGRRSFARALANRLDRIWKESSDSRSPASFILHLNGPWGSGKTTLLNFLEQELSHESRGALSRQNGEADRKSNWIVVWFNAWQLHRLEPPWWSLLDALFRQSFRQLVRSKCPRERQRAWWLWLREQGWRFVTGRRDFVATAGLLIFILIICYWVARSLPLNGVEDLGNGVEDLGNGAKHVNDVLALIGTLLSAGMVLSRSLLAGSATAAQAFVQSGTDPMQRIRKHFSRLVGTIKRPIIIFVDDLDRCQSNYVVGLLEGIQTLFNDPRVVYVIASDRRWLQSCFETSYSAFADTVNEPGRGLGSLFLEKAIQLSVSVPKLSTETRQTYWHFLIQGDQKDQAVGATDIEEIRQEFVSASSETAILDRLSKTNEHPVRQQLRRQVAVERLSTVEVERTTAYFLEPFAPLLEPNPRAMKRLINAYAVHRDLAILGGIDILGDIAKRKRLVLWTILSLQWPQIADYLIQILDSGRGDSNPELNAILSSEPVKRVLNGEGVEVALDLESIRSLAELRATPASISTVA